MELIEFCRKHFHLIFDMDGRVEGFLYPYEIDMLNHIHSKDYTLILKSRRMNVSSIYSLYLFWFLVNNSSPRNSIILVRDQNNSSIFNRLRGLNMTFESHYHLEFNGNSVSIVDAVTIARGRFEDVHMLLIDDHMNFDVIGSLFEKIHYQMDRNPDAKVSMANSASEDYFKNLWLSGDWYNYMAHYSKNPYWTFPKLKDSIRSHGTSYGQWNQTMECIYPTKDNKWEYDNDLPILNPYKNKTILKRIDALVSQLDD